MQAGPSPHELAAAVLASVDAGVCARFDVGPARASVSFVGVDPMQILRFEVAQDRVDFVSLGMCRAPMTAAEELLASVDGPRAELLMTTRPGSDAVWARLAVLAAAPAVEGVVYRPGMTVDLGSPIMPGSTCTGVLVGDPVGEGILTAAGPVDVLRVDAATQTELAWCRVHGTDALRDRWIDQRIDLADLRRAPASLA